ncbi:MAG: hypothetical protein QOE71_2142, partial [Pseudonocardiales bacterium]|nr:hypothetical protein [Pseudonocardiales bacterium]
MDDREACGSAVPPVHDREIVVLSHSLQVAPILTFF